MWFGYLPICYHPFLAVLKCSSIFGERLLVGSYTCVDAIVDAKSTWNKGGGYLFWGGLPIMPKLHLAPFPSLLLLFYYKSCKMQVICGVHKCGGVNMPSSIFHIISFQLVRLSNWVDTDLNSKSIKERNNLDIATNWMIFLVQLQTLEETIL